MSLNVDILKTRVIKTGISGLAATGVDLVAMVVLVEVFAVQVALAAFCSASFGAVVNYTLSKFWAFKDPAPIDYKQVATYAFVSLCTAILVALSVQLLAVVIGLPYLLAKVLAAIGVFLIWSYPAQAKLVFPKASLPEFADSGLVERRSA